MVSVTRMLMALSAVVLAVVLNWQEGNFTLEQQTVLEHRTASRHQPVEAVMSPQHHHHQEATLTDATSLYRVCSSRPQRILPTHKALRLNVLPIRAVSFGAIL